MILHEFIPSPFQSINKCGLYMQRSEDKIQESVPSLYIVETESLLFLCYISCHMNFQEVLPASSLIGIWSYRYRALNPCFDMGLGSDRSSGLHGQYFYKLSNLPSLEFCDTQTICTQKMNDYEQTPHIIHSHSKVMYCFFSGHHGHARKVKRCQPI